jgi:hypothetical protein
MQLWSAWCFPRQRFEVSMVAPFIARLLGTRDEGAKPRTNVKPMRGLHSSMGQRGVEPRTSRLSGVRSNNLSYWPC